MTRPTFAATEGRHSGRCRRSRRSRRRRRCRLLSFRRRRRPGRQRSNRSSPTCSLGVGYPSRERQGRRRVPYVSSRRSPRLAARFQSSSSRSWRGSRVEDSGRARVAPGASAVLGEGCACQSLEAPLHDVENQVVDGAEFIAAGRSDEPAKFLIFGVHPFRGDPRRALRRREDAAQGGPRLPRTRHDRDDDALLAAQPDADVRRSGSWTASHPVVRRGEKF